MRIRFLEIAEIELDEAIQYYNFPYGIIYQIRKVEVLVIAAANLHREPDYWEDRL